jgi:hypothetical protein
MLLLYKHDDGIARRPLPALAFDMAVHSILMRPEHSLFTTPFFASCHSHALPNPIYP